MSADAPLFPELDDERTRLRHARACRDRMIERFEQLDPAASADEVTKDYIEVTVLDALADLRTPGAGDFFGRIDEEPPVGATAITGTSAAATSRTTTTSPSSSTGGRRSPRPFYRATVARPARPRQRRPVPR